MMSSEKMIEKLKDHFGKINIGINSRWEGILKELKDDPMFSNADPLEQIT
jgi:hypothetical protein